ncbi:tetratricopeptide repeat protein [Hydrogenophaga crocea]|uniref:Tetratricopeptide repeat protein n=1 Tax=Hydrogenophaga crocea TaxID=2716225 RepID=A0A6G8IL16_9BURK|nr:tetratricopeptide repeat protein [Hydrogenophaga crocea]QIM53922.1 tetratricopeptide repeat protein [Hydrogenophaga crocea]
MRCPTRRTARAAASAALLAAALSCAHAAGPPPSSDLPDLAPLRAQVYAGEYARAWPRLTALARTVHHAELYNLLGYTARQMRRFDEAAHWYREALLYDPEHRGALEYQGELFLALGDVAAAQRNLRYLELLCGTGCREYRLLRQVLDAAVPSAPAAR